MTPLRPAITGNARSAARSAAFFDVRRATGDAARAGTAGRAVRRAFTLIEVLTATSIMVIILLAVMYVATETFKAYDDATATLQTTAESRNVLIPLRQDLESAFIRNDGNVWFQVEHEEAVGNVRKASAPKIMFFAAVPDRAKKETGKTAPIPGDICAICYQIGQRSPFDAPGQPHQQIYALYRAVADSKATFDDILPAVVNTANSGSKRSQNFVTDIWTRSASVLDSSGNRRSQSLKSWALETQNYIATNIVGLTLVFIYYEIPKTTGAKKQLKALVHEDIAQPIRDAYAKSGVEIQVETYTTRVRLRSGQILRDDNDEPIPAELRSIELGTTILRPNGARDLRARQRADKTNVIPTDKFDELLKAEGETFTDSIKMSK
ncbi:MAG: prepilin-type N-terminal cleavage/methylation domain-containing protein [Puniceicoccales bacterium]|jgi:prepilin-type N-terminal cleavage/methylation domain-containing protein|nr:prepilin-type N-terminal cleavage/methylation domain-containing protein [Puniceicoccales bacterium]